MFEKLKDFSIFDKSEELARKIARKFYVGDNPNELYAYEYFFFFVISQIMWIISSLTISIFLGCILEFCVFTFCWILERRKSGGMHLSTHRSCFYTSVFLTTTFSFLARILINRYMFLFLIGYANILSVIYYVPKKVETTYDYTVEEEFMFKKKFCRNTSILFIVNCLCLYFGYIYNLDILKCFSNCISLSMILTSLMLYEWFEKLLKFVWKEK